MIHEVQKDAIYEQSWKIIESMKNPEEKKDWRKPSTFDIELKKLQEIIHKIPEIFDFVSDHDIHDFFFFRLTMIEKLTIEKIDLNTLKKVIDRYFFSEPKVLDYYFRIGRSGDFPNGFEVGTGDMISYENLPDDVKKSLEGYWKLFYEDDKFRWEKTVDEYAERQKTYAYIHFQIKSIGGFKSSEKAFIEVRKNTNILKFVYGDSFFGENLSSPYLYCWKIGQNIGAHISKVYSPDEFYRIAFLDEQVKEISEIIKKDIKDDIERRLVNVVEICGLIEYETPLRVRFLLKVICLEALLLDKDDRDHLGSKLAEKISLLLGDSKAWMHTYFKLNVDDAIEEQFVNENRTKARIGLEKIVKCIYDTRSSFAHGDTGDFNENSEFTEQYATVSSLLRWTSEILLKLHKSRIKRIRKNSIDDQTSLDYYLQTLKYAKSGPVYDAAHETSSSSNSSPSSQP